MAASMPPTRHDLLIALRFPVLAGPFLLVTLRYRFFGPHVWSARFRDGVDFNREAWRLSAYLTVLFVFVAYPVVLSKHDDWLWSVHAQLSTAFVVFWLSSAGWLAVRQIQLRNLADQKLFKDLAAISQGRPETPPFTTPVWLRAWAVANAIALGCRIAGICKHSEVSSITALAAVLAFLPRPGEMTNGQFLLNLRPS